MFKPLKAVLLECVGEIANAFAIAAYKQKEFIGFHKSNEDEVGKWIDEMTEWILIAGDEFDQDSDDCEVALDAIRALIYQLFQDADELKSDSLNP